MPARAVATPVIIPMSPTITLHRHRRRMPMATSSNNNNNRNIIIIQHIITVILTTDSNHNRVSHHHIITMIDKVHRHRVARAHHRQREARRLTIIRTAAHPPVVVALATSANPLRRHTQLVASLPGIHIVTIRTWVAATIHVATQTDRRRRRTRKQTDDRAAAAPAGILPAPGEVAQSSITPNIDALRRHPTRQ